jgi:hypothetical protein
MVDPGCELRRGRCPSSLRDGAVNVGSLTVENAERALATEWGAELNPGKEAWCPGVEPLINS